MTDNARTARSLMRTGGWLVGHTAALIVGLVLMLAGIGMGVSIVMLPAGVPVGLVGLFLFLWGALGTSRTNRAAATKPTP